MIIAEEMVANANTHKIAITPVQPTQSKKAVWAGRGLTTLGILFLIMDSAMKIVKAGPAIQGSIELGYPPAVIPGIGFVLLLCTLLYAVPRTAILGAVLLTGYLGGAIATQVRVGNPLFSHVLFPIYFAAILWGGLYLRDRRVRQLLASPAKAASR